MVFLLPMLFNLGISPLFLHVPYVQHLCVPSKEKVVAHNQVVETLQSHGRIGCRNGFKTQ